MKNSPNIETLDKSRHGKLRVKPSADYVHAKGFNLVSITLGELGACANNFPIVFVPTPDGRLRPVAVLGLAPGENVYYGEKEWDSTYVPRLIQTHPFVIGFDDRKDDSIVVTACIDKTSPYLSEDEGVAMFKEDGEQTDLVSFANRLLHELYESQKVTDQFCEKLAEIGLLVPFDLILEPQNGELRRVTGMSTINDRKLRELTPEQLQELYKTDFLSASYIILDSLFQMSRLMQLRNKQNDEKIINFMTELANKQPQPESQPQPQTA